MRLLIHDLEKQALNQVFPGLDESVRVIRSDEETHACIGCFGCWIKTPAVCIIPDECQKMGALLGHSSEALIISRCCYGGYSPTVKKAIDRCIGYLLPHFEIRRGEVHHISRYPEKLKLTVRLYGEDISAEERAIAEQLVQANGLNLNVSEASVRFYRSPAEMKGEAL